MHAWAGVDVPLGINIVFPGLAAAAAAKLLQSCLTSSDPMDCSLTGSSVHGIYQARVLEWVVPGLELNLKALI